ncbi:hypothetical protein J6590_064473 [Homalodisca vitripennis]|nr:hypothetical protein J6590_064473 [Homalodisca vitripennis]
MLVTTIKFFSSFCLSAKTSKLAWVMRMRQCAALVHFHSDFVGATYVQVTVAYHHVRTSSLIAFRPTNKNGKPLILHHNYKYRESHCLKNGERPWRCLGRNCGATLKTNAEATRLVSCSGKHQGPHPVTMRTLSLSPAPTPPAASPATPASASTLVASSAQSAATPALSSDAELPASPATSTGASIPVVCLDSASAAEVADLVAENKVLQDRLLQLEEQFKHVLDHSIESDTRLMQYTNQVFVASTPRVDSPVRVSATDCGVQCDLPINCGDQWCAETRDLVASLRTTIEVLEAELKCLREREESKQPHTSPTHAPQITVGNRYMALSDLNDEDTASFTVVRRKKKNARKKTTNKKQKHISSKKHDHDTKSKKHTKLKKTILPFKNVTVLGDSHSRHLSAIMRAQTAGHTNIIGVCKPGAGLLQIAPSHAPPENHCYVLVAGTNDLAAGRQDIVFQHMEEVIKSCRISSNILVPIHESIALANSYVSELCERYEGVAMMDISVLGREHFTPHGLHLTTTGKSLLAGLIVKELTIVYLVTASEPPLLLLHPASQLRGGCDQPTCWAVHQSQAKGMSVRP